MRDQQAVILADSHKNWTLRYAILQGGLIAATQTLSTMLCCLLGSNIPHKKDNTTHFVHTTTLTALSMNMLIYPAVCHGLGLYKKRNLATPEAVREGIGRTEMITQYTLLILYIAVSLGSIPLTEKLSSAPANETVSFDDGAKRFGIGFGVLCASAWGFYCCLFAALAACASCTNDTGKTEDETTPLMTNPTYTGP
jgi:hypothetical protein